MSTVANWLLQKTSQATNTTWLFLYQLADNVYGALVFLMKEMIKLITQFPLLSHIPEISEVWKMITILSMGCIALLIIYVGTQTFLSAGSSTMRSIEIKTIFGRLISGLCFIGLSRFYIDMLINLNNLLIAVITERFDITSPLEKLGNTTITGNLIAAALILYQMYLAIKIMIGYWLRVAEVNLMYVASPIMYTLWINPSWATYLGTWNARLMTLVFTQFVQVIIMVIYGQTIFAFFQGGSISNLCMAVASLVLMNNAPMWIMRFAAPDNSGMIMTKTYQQMKRGSSKIATRVAGMRAKLLAKKTP